MKSHLTLVSLSLAALFILSGCQVSLAGDVTPPPGYRPPSPAPQVTAQAVLPVVPPDPAQGAALYADKCAPCHGVSGMGDGPQAAKLPSPVQPIGTAEAARAVKPITWFNVITQGKIERMMPPFQSLTDRQRWDLVAYLFTLSTTPKTLEAGKAIFEEKCVSCHGAKGNGDGAMAASLPVKVPDWRDLSRLAQLSASDIATIISNGKGAAMPQFASVLTEEQRYAAAAYIRSLNFANSTAQVSLTPAPSPAATNPATPPASTPAISSTPAVTMTPLSRVAFTGKVSHAANKTLPDDLKATLQGYDLMQKTWEVTTDVKNGQFEFKDVELVANRIYMVSVMYQGLEYVSDAVHTADLGANPVVDLPVTLYDTSTDASVLLATRVHIFLDFTLPGRVQVAQLFVISNPTPNAIVAVSPTQPSLLFDLPVGYANLQFQDGELGGRFIQTEKGFGDLLEVPPLATQQVLFGFDLPYPNNTATFSLPFNLPVEAVVLMTPADGVTVQSPNLVSSGKRQMDTTSINLYTGAGFTKGSALAITVSGQPTSGAAVTDISASNGLLIGLGVFGVALIVAGVFLFRQRQNQKEELDEEEDENEDAEEDEESILDAIAALDDLYQAGQLADEAYAERRAELKARYRALKE